MKSEQNPWVLGFEAVCFLIGSLFEKKPSVLRPETVAMELLRRALAADEVTLQEVRAALKSWDGSDGVDPTFVDLVRNTANRGFNTRMLIQYAMLPDGGYEVSRPIQSPGARATTSNGSKKHREPRVPIAVKMTQTVHSMIVDLGTAPANEKLLAQIFHDV